MTARAAPGGAFDQAALQATTENRRLVTALSVLSGAAGLLPLPLLGDLAIDATRASLIQRLARRRGVQLSARAALIVAGASRPELGRTALAALLTVGIRLVYRQIARLLLWALRFEDMGRTFLLGTLFDYHCLAHPPAAPLGEAEAERLRRALGAALGQARELLASRAFRRSLEELLRAGTWLPRRLGRLLIALLSGQTDSVEEEVEQDPEGLFGRVVQRLERELAELEVSLLEDLCRSFETSWAAEAKSSV